MRSRAVAPSLVALLALACGGPAGAGRRTDVAPAGAGEVRAAPGSPAAGREAPGPGPAPRASAESVQRGRNHPPPARVPRASESVPGALRLAAERGEEAAALVQRRLAPRVASVARAGGDAAAVRAYPALLAEVLKQVRAETGAREVGFTSDRLRSPENQPPRWARTRVGEAAGKTADRVTPVAVDLGDAVGVLVPVAAGRRCLACHGVPSRLEAPVRAALAEAYPADAAAGYAPGDHRGFAWAVVPRLPALAAR